MIPPPKRKRPAARRGVEQPGGDRSDSSYLNIEPSASKPKHEREVFASMIEDEMGPIIKGMRDLHEAVEADRKAWRKGRFKRSDDGTR